MYAPRDDQTKEAGHLLGSRHGCVPTEIVIDCNDPELVANFWCAVLGWPLQRTEKGDLWTSLGATKVDIGQGDTPWIVLADPEGNEFCLLGRRVD